MAVVNIFICLYHYMFISLHVYIFIFFLPHKHAYNRKKIARRTIWRDYIGQIRCGYRFKYLRIMIFSILMYSNKRRKTFCIVINNVLSIIINIQNTTTFEPVILTGFYTSQ